MKPPENIIRLLVRQWLDKAEQDLKAAEALLSLEPPLFYPACFHAQQAAEKFLKAFLTWQQIEFPKTHSVGELLDLAERANASLAADLKAATALTPYGVEVRYPAEAPEPTRAQTAKAIKLAQKVRQRVWSILPGEI